MSESRDGAPARRRSRPSPIVGYPTLGARAD